MAGSGVGQPRPATPLKEGIIIDNIEELLRLDKRIDTAEERAVDSIRDSLRDRWEFGKLMLSDRVEGGRGRGRGPKLPVGYLDGLVEKVGKSRQELQRRMLFAERYSTEDELSQVMRQFTTWTDVIKSLPKPSEPPEPSPSPKPPKSRESKPRAKPARPPARNKKAEKIVDLAEQGKTRQQIAEETGASDRTVRRELETEARDLAIAEAARPLDWATIPGNQQVKLERAKASIRRELEKEFHTRLLAEVDQHRAKLDADWAAHKATYDAQNQVMRDMRDEERKRYQLGIEVQRAKGLITPSEYMTILACLHPDNSASTEKRAEAFRLFNDAKIKILLVKEK